MFVVKKEKDNILSIPAKEILPENAKHIGSKLAISIITELSKNPNYVIGLAKKLKVHEQKIYYHIRKLEKAGIVSVVKEEEMRGAVAKYYALDEPSFVLRFQEFSLTSKIGHLQSESPYLVPFVKDGKLNAIIVVGSPDPHGPEKARSRDGYYAIDLGLFLGTFLNYVPNPNVRLDTEVKPEELKKNLILIGGPVVNKITNQANAKLPIRFDPKNHFAIMSSVSGKTYPSDECGLIVKAKNPFNPDAFILVVAGKRYSGTRAAIIAFLRHFNEISSGNKHNNRITAKVVEGVDMDSDGMIDDVEVRE